MTSTTHQAESSAPALYVAFELSTKEWLLTMSPAMAVAPRRQRIRAGDRTRLTAALAEAKTAFGLPAEALVRSCCEAGRDGFWPHRLLTALGVINLVVDSASIEVSRRAKHTKTDRLDGNKLLRLLFRHWSGERDMWQVVHVPSAALEDRRHANRTRTMLQVERTRYRNRIHALLILHGVRLRIDRTLPDRLATAVDWAGAPLPPGVQARIRVLWELLHAVEIARTEARRAEARALRQAPETDPARRLARLCGIAARGATVIGDELFSRQLRNRREVGALTGLVSAPYHSGERRIDQGLTRGGLPHVRHIAVQLSWGWVRYQPTSALSVWYRRRFAGRGAVAERIGIVALARRLMIALWRYVEYGVVPEGAVLKKA